MQRILIICSHPDDEILGCGSTARKHVLAGDEVYCLILGEGALCHGITQDELMEQSLKAGKIIGFTDMFFEDYPDNMMDDIPLLDIIQTIEPYIDNIKPEVIFTHYRDDLNIDHRITFQACLTSVRPGITTVREIYSFEIPSSTEWQFPNSFNPNYFVDISATLNNKLKAMRCYKSELKEYPHPRSLRAIHGRAGYWGQCSGLEYAEAFEVVRIIK
jgi:LmbE family N-acetylglucosaminyl deacetylase